MEWKRFTNTGKRQYDPSEKCFLCIETYCVTSCILPGQVNFSQGVATQPSATTYPGIPASKVVPYHGFSDLSDQQIAAYNLTVHVIHHNICRTKPHHTPGGTCISVLCDKICIRYLTANCEKNSATACNNEDN